MRTRSRHITAWAVYLLLTTASLAQAQEIAPPAGLSLRQEQGHVTMQLAVSPAATFISYQLHQPERLVLEFPTASNTPSGAYFFHNHPTLQAILLSQGRQQSGQVIKRWVIVLHQHTAYDLRLRAQQLQIRLFHPQQTLQASASIPLYATPPNSAVVTAARPAPVRPVPRTAPQPRPLPPAQQKALMLTWFARWLPGLEQDQVVLRKQEKALLTPVEQQEKATQPHDRTSSVPPLLDDAEAQVWSQAQLQTMARDLPQAELEQPHAQTWRRMHQSLQAQRRLLTLLTWQQQLTALGESSPLPPKTFTSLQNSAAASIAQLNRKAAITLSRLIPTAATLLNVHDADMYQHRVHLIREDGRWQRKWFPWTDDYRNWVNLVYNKRLKIATLQAKQAALAKLARQQKAKREKLARQQKLQEQKRLAELRQNAEKQKRQAELQRRKEEQERLAEERRQEALRKAEERRRQQALEEKVRAERLALQRKQETLRKQEELRQRREQARLAELRRKEQMLQERQRRQEKIERQRLAKQSKQERKRMLWVQQQRQRQWQAWQNAALTQQNPLYRREISQLQRNHRLWEKSLFTQAQQDLQYLAGIYQRIQQQQQRELQRDSRVEYRTLAVLRPQRWRRRERRIWKRDRWWWAIQRSRMRRRKLALLRQQRRTDILQQQAWMRRQRQLYEQRARQLAEAQRRKQQRVQKPPTLLDIFDQLVPQPRKKPPSRR